MAGEDFWEFKASQQRIFWCYDPGRRRRIVLLHGFTKKTAQTPRNQLEAGRHAYRELQQELSIGRKERMEQIPVIKEWSRQYEGDPEFEFDLLAIEIGERIVERMELLKMTRTELAAKIGVSKARISQILSGHDNLTLKSLVAVATGLGSRIDVRLKSEERWLPHDVTVQHLALGEPSTFASSA